MIRMSGSSPVIRATRSHWRPAQLTIARALSTVPEDVRTATPKTRRSTARTSSPQRMSASDAAASCAATAPKSQIPVVPTWIAASPRTSGSCSMICAGPSSRTGMPFSRPRWTSACSRGSSSRPVATISLPVTWWAMPYSAQNLTISAAPRTAKRAFSDPGR